MSYFPQVLVPSAHKMVVTAGALLHGESTTFIRLYVGMTEYQFHRSSGAQRENCRESFTVDRLRDGRYKLTHTTSSVTLHDKGKKVFTVTTTSNKIDERLQKFVDSLAVELSEEPDSDAFIAL